jgi:signal transduction histidine kinase
MWTKKLFPSWFSETKLLAYLLAILATVLVLILAQPLSRVGGITLAYILLFPVVAFSSWYCGTGPAVLATLLAIVGLRYWLIAPVRSLLLPDSENLVGMVAFLLVSGLVIAMGETRRRVNRQLRRAHAELEDRVRERTAELGVANTSLRDLSARLLQSRDEERRRLARELHDSVGQTLAALSMNLTTVRTDIERLTNTANTLTDSEGLVQEITKEVRTISHLLHPPLLDEAGLASALQWFVDGFSQRSKIIVDLILPNDFGRLSRELETAIFRVVQECLTNIHRHSGSPSAHVRLRRHGGQILVEVEDKGKGIPPGVLQQMLSGGIPGVGVRGMRERLRQLGGTLEIISEGYGTRVTVYLPAVEAAAETDLTEPAGTSSIAAA